MAQIHVTDVLVGQDGIGIAFGNDLAITYDVGVIADIQRFTHVVIGNQNADAAVAQLTNDVLDFTHRDGVDAREWFIKQDERGIHGQCARYFDAATFTTGQAHPHIVADMRDAEFFQQCIQMLVALLTSKVLTRFQNRQNIICHRQLAEDRRFLRQVANACTCALMHRTTRQVHIVNAHFTSVGLNQTDNHVERCGLAGTVGAEQTHDLTLRNGETDILHDAAFLEAFGQMRCVEGLHRGLNSLRLPAGIGRAVPANAVCTCQRVRPA
ncbi:pyruvate decarboxylase [Zymobacter palmae]|uniref:Pyruvate decarboxylase n=1 Tax=Zymobacter palmae TaxID=33074 RepID=A0A348HGW5_9GAMM|nr:pyruvate decarboxylase [Zymobacter palmae]